MSSNHFMGTDGFVWFIGVVEDRDDPSELGRVRVRCVGFHTEDKTRIPTEGLPWAHVMHPVTDPSMSGMGQTPSFLVEGTWVVGFFRDAEEKQQPIVMGTLPGVPEDLGNPNIGFNDPNRRDDDSSKPGYNISIYPREEDVPDVNRLARNETVKWEGEDVSLPHSVIASKDKLYDEETHKIGRTEKVQVANTTDEKTNSGYIEWDEPKSPYAASYPNNNVMETASGHIKEYDDTSGQERIHEYHKAGTFYEIDKDGNKVTRVVGNNYDIIAGTNYVKVRGDVFLTIDSNCKTRIKGNYEVEVDGNKNEVIKGTYTQTVTGAVTETYNSTKTETVEDKVSETYKKDQQTNVTGTIDIDATTEVDIDAGEINLN